MKGLILKDILNLKKTIKSMLVIGIAYCILFSNINPMLLTGLLTLLFTMQSLSSFSYDEYAKWDCYALTLPISKRDFVLSKYVLFIIFPIIGSILSIIATIIVCLLKNNLALSEILASSMGYLFSMELMILILLPIIYKFGVERGRLMMIIIPFAIGAVGFLIFKLAKGFNLISPTIEQIYVLTPTISILAIIFLAIIGYISYQISLRIIYKKEY